MRGIALMLVIGLAACGGRVAKPVEEVRTTDAALTCDHIHNEAEVNAVRILDLLGEKQAASDQNAAKLMALPLSIAFPMFIDLRDSEQQEIAALEKRNKRLAVLGAERGCPFKA